MKLTQEIRKKFSDLSLSDNSSYELEYLPSTAPAWAIKIDGEYAVGVEIDKETKVNESFTSVSYYTQEYIVDGVQRNLLILSNSAVQLRSEFAGIAAMFLEPGENNVKRNEILENPHKWWEDWKDLLGNKNVENTVQGMVGELLFLSHLKSVYGNEISIDSWTGPKGGSQDFLLEVQTFEVKTTLVKYNDVVNISGHYQIQDKEQSNLIFIRLENILSGSKTTNAVSIKSLLERLTTQGFEFADLNSYVTRMGFKENSRDRSMTFKLLEMRRYSIDENFPAIDLSNVENASNVLQINFKMSLAGLEYESLHEMVSETITSDETN